MSLAGDIAEKSDLYVPLNYERMVNIPAYKVMACIMTTGAIFLPI